MDKRSPAPPQMPSATAVGASGAPGLVTSATSGEVPSDASQLLEELGGYFRFPSADLVAASVALFDRERVVRHSWRREWTAETWRDVKSGAQLGAAEYRPYFEPVNGPTSFLTVGPGFVKVGRVDLDRQEQAQERERCRRLSAAQLPDAAEPVELSDELPAPRVIAAWSAKSRARLIQTVAALDLAPLVSGASIPCMVTLTLPGDWLAVAPDAETAAGLLHNFARAWRDRWGTAPQWIWKREFQRRGAPHWHIWTVPPTTDSWAFREWLSAAWTRTLKPSRTVDRGAHIVSTRSQKCVCSEYCRSETSGTGVDYAEGMRARDPRRLAVYFLKETLGGEGKAYQNGPPAEWAGQSVGRFWGVRGIPKATTTIAIDPEQHVRIWRELERARIRQSPLMKRRVPRGIDPATGEVGTRTRLVTRRRKVYGSAGWVTVNNGAAFAEQLARMLDAPRRRPWSPRDPSTMPASTRVDVSATVNYD